MQTATETQIKYRDDLITKLTDSIRDSYAQVPAPGAQPVKAAPDQVVLSTANAARIRAAALALALPRPASKQDASDQIDALQRQGAGLVPYARDHRDWAQPVLDALIAAWGRDAAGRPATITVGALRELGTAR